jgi:hypothetical protein
MQIAQMSWSNVTVWSIELPPRNMGEQSTSPPARTCANQPPPSSRAISPPRTTITAPARAGHTRGPTSECPKTRVDSLATIAVSGG